MTWSADATAILDALRAHPQRAMTATELAAKVRGRVRNDVDAVLAALQREGEVVLHELRSADPHFPPIVGVAPVAPDGSAEAVRRAAGCAAVVERQLMRSHRCQ